MIACHLIVNTIQKREKTIERLEQNKTECIAIGLQFHGIVLQCWHVMHSFGRMDRQTDGRTYWHSILPTTNLEVQQSSSQYGTKINKELQKSTTKNIMYICSYLLLRLRSPSRQSDDNCRHSNFKPAPPPHNIHNKGICFAVASTTATAHCIQLFKNYG